eukprot:Phypoly_transcript_13095.p1 GENE.Phypoly_transcript_13095~~Phypoly_transcript_13095.p1  ORF type:complete len:273 (-),score=46.66 Phypoly_transcript_13095:19-837(-)
MERGGEPKGSEGESGGVDVYTRGCFGFPAAVGLDLGEGPSRKGKESGSTMLEGIPGVGGHVGLFTFGFEPVIEGGLIDGEYFVKGGVGAGRRENGEGFEGGWKETHVCAGSFLVCFGEGEVYVFVFEEEGGPGEVENFFGADEGVKTGDKKNVVVELKGGEVCKEGIKMIDGEPLGGAGATVVFSVGAKAKRGDGFHRSREVVEPAPHFDGRGGAVYFAIGVLVLEAGENELVDGVGGERGKEVLAAEEDVLSEVGGVGVVGGVGYGQEGKV